jgi:lysophospholipase L1-like esterase
VLGPTGLVLWTKTLPIKDEQNNPLSAGAQSMSLAVDAAGKIVMTRGYSREALPSGWSVPNIRVTMLSNTNGTALYDQKMVGNLSEADGPITGYLLKNTDRELTIGPETAYVYADECPAQWCNYGTYRTKAYPIKIPGLLLQYPASEILGQAVPARLSYAGLGDSFSSGQGAKVYDTGTVTPTNQCYRSANAYARLLDSDPSVPLQLTKFVACGGATTTDIYQSYTYPDAPPQNTALSSATNVVTLTIGGNDIGFSDVIRTCANPVQDCDGAFSLANDNLGMLDTWLPTAYLNILQKAPNAKIYVVGYPRMVVAGPSCLLTGENGTDFPFTEERKLKAVTLLNALNKKISDNVASVRSLGSNYARLRFVDAAASDSPFAGHDVCSTDPYFNGLLLNSVPESFHPNEKGQAAYAQLAVKAIKAG